MIHIFRFICLYFHDVKKTVCALPVVFQKASSTRWLAPRIENLKNRRVRAFTLEATQMFRSWFARITLVVFITSLLAGSGFAQTDTARIQGTVTDPTGAVVPNATITVTNTDQGRTFSATSDGSGN